MLEEFEFWARLFRCSKRRGCYHLARAIHSDQRIWEGRQSSGLSPELVESWHKVRTGTMAYLICVRNPQTDMTAYLWYWGLLLLEDAGGYAGEVGVVGDLRGRLERWRQFWKRLLIMRSGSVLFDDRNSRLIRQISQRRKNVYAIMSHLRKWSCAKVFNENSSRASLVVSKEWN